MMAAHDVLIVGGGPVGATLALALQGSGLSVQVLEARPAGLASSDPRALALSQGSRLILERLGVWQSLAGVATPIQTIHVSQRGHLGCTVLHAEEEGLDALGYVLPYAELSNTLDRALGEAEGIGVVHGARVQSLETNHQAATAHYERDGQPDTAVAGLAVMADGGRSLAELPGIKRSRKEYGHSALVAQVSCELPHAHVAYERFTDAGPVALLPTLGSHDFALVWTADHEHAQELSVMDSDEFLAQLHRHFGDRVGVFREVGERIAFPLHLTTMRPVTSTRLAVIGNAAQTLHPVAGQGFNLGLRDAWTLASELQAVVRSQVGSPEMLARYRARRRLDTGGGIVFTDFLVRAFSNRFPGLGHVRGSGLVLTELFSPAKHLVARKMSFGATG